MKRSELSPITRVGGRSVFMTLRHLLFTCAGALLACNVSPVRAATPNLGFVYTQPWDATTQWTPFDTWLGSTVLYRDSFCAGSAPTDTWAEWDKGPWFISATQSWVARSANHREVIALPLIPPGATFAQVYNNTPDGNNVTPYQHFQNWAQKVIDAGVASKIYVRLGWEFNQPSQGQSGNWFPWGCGSDAAGYAKAFHRAVQALRSKIPGLKIIWNPNCGGSQNWQGCWPTDNSGVAQNGDVDYIGLDAYDDSAWAQRLNNTPGLQEIRNFAATKGKPECWPEWGLRVNGDNPSYIQNMYNFMTSGTNVFYQAFWNDTCCNTIGIFQTNPIAPNSANLYKTLFGPAGGSGSLSGSTVNAATASTYALTTLAGASGDWAHWNSTGFVHKSGTGGNQISNVTQVGGGSYGNNASLTTRAVSWTDGTPTASNALDRSYFWCNGTTGKGWSLTVPASSTSRTLNVYWGGAPYAGVAIKLVAHLNDNSAPDYIIPLANTASVYSYVTTLTYTAATSTTLTVTLTKDDTNPNTSVDIIAAWLTGGGAGSGNAHGGTWAVRGTPNGTPTNHNFYQSVSGIPSGSTYKGSIWIKGSGQVVLRIMNSNWNSTLTSVTATATSTWTQVTTPNFSTTGNSTMVFVLTDSPNGGAGTYYVDDLYLGSTSGSPNMLANPGLESGNTVWTAETPFTILQNP